MELKKQYRMAYHSLKCSWLRLCFTSGEAEKYAAEELQEIVAEAEATYPDLRGPALAAQVSRLARSK